MKRRREREGRFPGLQVPRLVPQVARRGGAGQAGTREGGEAGRGGAAPSCQVLGLRRAGPPGAPASREGRSPQARGPGDPGGFTLGLGCPGTPGPRKPRGRLGGHPCGPGNATRPRPLQVRPGQVGRAGVHLGPTLPSPQQKVEQDTGSRPAVTLGRSRGFPVPQAPETALNEKENSLFMT